MVIVGRERRELAPGEIRIDVLATGICGSDIHGIAGDTGRREVGQIMGHETCGVVIEVAEDVASELIGLFGAICPVMSCGECMWCQSGQQQVCREVWILGVKPDIDAAFAEEVVVPLTAFVPLNDIDDSALGALVEPLAVGFHAARQASINSHSRVLVIGAGPIGQASALGAQTLGCASPVLIEPTAARRQVAEDLGLSVLDSGLADDEIIDALGGLPNVVIDAVGATATLNRAIVMSEVRADIVLVGMASPNVEVPAYEISTKERRIAGSYCYSRDSFEAAARWLQANQSKALRILDSRVEIDQAPGVIRGLAVGSHNLNKVVIVL